MLLVHLDNIATTYCSRIFQTHVFSLNSDRCMYVSQLLPIYHKYIWIGWGLCLRAIRGAHEDDNWRNSEIHFGAVVEVVWRYSQRLWSDELRDALWGCDLVSWEMHIEAIIQRESRSTWMRSIWRWSTGGAPGVETLFIRFYHSISGNVKRWLHLWGFYG